MTTAGKKKRKKAKVNSRGEVVASIAQRCNIMKMIGAPLVFSFSDLVNARRFY